MIEILPTTETDQLEFRLSGHITQAEYEAALVPAVEAALAKHDRVRVLVILDTGFTGLDMGAAWADTKMGLSHWRGFDRVAVVTDSSWIRVGTRAMAAIFPCPVQVFPAAELAAARDWQRAALGSINVAGLGGNAVQVAFHGKLAPEFYETLGPVLDAQIKDHGSLQLLLDLRDFDGWQGLSALGAHLKLARTHVADLQRIAVVADSAWVHMTERVIGGVVKAETKFFSADAFEAAKAWVTKV
jgi:hypothetical protein